MANAPTFTTVKLTALQLARLGDPIRIHWFDAHRLESAWLPTDGFNQEPLKVVSVGLFVAATKEMVYYAGDLIALAPHESRVNSVNGVPLGCIVKLEILRESNE